eukprot:3049612-Rhodomonas_salina.1
MEYRCLVYWKRVSCPRRRTRVGIPRQKTHPLLFDFPVSTEIPGYQGRNSNPDQQPMKTHFRDESAATTMYPGRGVQQSLQ